MFRLSAVAVVLLLANPVAFGEDPPKVAKEVERLRKLLAGKNPSDRIEAILGLKKIGPAAKAAVPDLITLLGSKDRRGGGAAMETVIAIGSAGVPSLINFLESKNTEERTSAAHAIGQIGETAASAVPFLRQRIKKEEDAFAKLTMIAALGKIGPAAKAAVPDLIELLGSTDLGIRGATIGSLRGLGKVARSAAAALVKLAADDKNDETLRVDSLRALIDIDAPQKTVNTSLLQLLETQSPDVRSAVLDVARSLGPKGKDLVTPLTKIRDAIPEDTPNRDRRNYRKSLTETIEKLSPAKEK